MKTFSESVLLTTTALRKAFGVFVLFSVLRWLAVALCVGGCPLSSLLAQGSLTPPGTPAPTMKSLDQIASTGTAINSANTPGDASNDFIINQAGSYYLAANIAAAKPNAVQINAAGVTLDLNGFQISKGSGSGNVGIYIAPTAHGANVHNGSVNGFSWGVYSVASTDRAHGCIYRDLNISGCARYGILAGYGSVIESCRAHDNGPSPDNAFNAAIAAEWGSVLKDCVADHNTLFNGIFADSGSSLINCSVFKNTNATTGISGGPGVSLTNCSAYNNTALAGIYADVGSALNNCSAYSNTVQYGIYAGAGSSLANCTGSTNTSTNATSYGIYAPGCSILGCTARANTNTNASGSGSTGVGIYAGSDSIVKNCTAALNKGDGIQASQRAQINDCTATSNGSGTNGSGIITDIRAVVQHCSASDNQRNGIVVLGGSTVLENTVNHNGVGGPAAGIDSSGGFGSRIEGNQARDNAGTGILTNSGPGDVVIRNSVGGTTAMPFSPNSGPNFGTLQLPSMATNPMANISF